MRFRLVSEDCEMSQIEHVTIIDLSVRGTSETQCERKSTADRFS